MHRLTIDKLGPIQHCDLQIQQYTVLTGFQASGKSTIAKAIYFFRSLSDDLYKLMVQAGVSRQIPRGMFACQNTGSPQQQV